MLVIFRKSNSKVSKANAIFCTNTAMKYKIYNFSRTFSSVVVNFYEIFRFSTPLNTFHMFCFKMAVCSFLDASSGNSRRCHKSMISPLCKQDKFPVLILKIKCRAIRDPLPANVLAYVQNKQMTLKRKNLKFIIIL